MPQPLILEADELCGVPSTFIFRYGDVPALQNIANAHGVVFAGAQPAPANAPGASGVAQNGNPSASASAPVTAQPANSNAGLQVAQNGNPPAYALAPVTVERANNNAALQVAQNGTPSASASVPVTVQPANSNAGLHVAPARPQRSTHEMVVDQASTTSTGNVTGHGAADAVPQDRPCPSSEEQKPSHPSGSPSALVPRPPSLSKAILPPRMETSSARHHLPPLVPSTKLPRWSSKRCLDWATGTQQGSVAYDYSGNSAKMACRPHYLDNFSGCLATNIQMHSVLVLTNTDQISSATLQAFHVFFFLAAFEWH